MARNRIALIQSASSVFCLSLTEHLRPQNNQSKKSAIPAPAISINTSRIAPWREGTKLWRNSSNTAYSAVRTSARRASAQCQVSLFFFEDLASARQNNNARTPNSTACAHLRIQRIITLAWSSGMFGKNHRMIGPRMRDVFGTESALPDPEKIRVIQITTGSQYRAKDAMPDTPHSKQGQGRFGKSLLRHRLGCPGRP